MEDKAPKVVEAADNFTRSAKDAAIRDAIRPHPGQWTEERAQAWYAQQPWLKGANYLPATAINQLEMWQEDTFDPERIDLELGWAAELGMNTMRVFLHDLCWRDDAEGFVKRVDAFLAICEKHKIRPLVVLFDSVWDPFPVSGKQREPKPGVHNSGWVQSPGARGLTDPSQHSRLESYVKGIVGAFARDLRILAWDVWNEPDNINGVYGGDGQIIHGSYVRDEPPNKVACVIDLLPKVFDWARAAKPIQPLTCGIWKGDWTTHDILVPVEKIQIDESDFISFHNYGDAQDFEKRIGWLQKYNRPIMCTEWMARPFGSTFGNILPLARKFNVAVYNWGFVEGKSQTNLPWDSWSKPYVDGREPEIWFHDILRRDGTAYRAEEIQALKMA